MENWPWLLLALSAGLCLPLQAGINTRLAGVIDGTLQASFISFLGGTLGLLLWLLAARLPLPLARAWQQGAWWYFAGGLLGAYFVYAVILLAPRLGAAQMVALVVAGQTLAALALDHFGLLGYPLQPISLSRICGVLLLAAGVWLVRA